MQVIEVWQDGELVVAFDGDEVDPDELPDGNYELVYVDVADNLADVLEAIEPDPRRMGVPLSRDEIDSVIDEVTP